MELGDGGTLVTFASGAFETELSQRDANCAWLGQSRRTIRCGEHILPGFTAFLTAGQSSGRQNRRRRFCERVFRMIVTAMLARMAFRFRPKATRWIAISFGLDQHAVGAAALILTLPLCIPVGGQRVLAISEKTCRSTHHLRMSEMSQAKPVGRRPISAFPRRIFDVQVRTVSYPIYNPQNWSRTRPSPGVARQSSSCRIKQLGRIAGDHDVARLS